MFKNAKEKILAVSQFACQMFQWMRKTIVFFFAIIKKYLNLNAIQNYEPPALEPASSLCSCSKVVSDYEI